MSAPATARFDGAPHGMISVHVRARSRPYASLARLLTIVTLFVVRVPPDSEAAQIDPLTQPSTSQPLRTGAIKCDQGTGVFGDCLTSRPQGQDAAAAKGAPRSYRDNQDGTISDLRTGLMWEKLVSDESIHGFAKLYSWYEAMDIKIAALNRDGGFAGHSDWRLPNVNELQSLADYGRFSPAIDPAFNTDCAAGGCSSPSCSCTKPFHYWSSTSSESRAASGWLVSFDGGYVVSDVKSNLYYVRAVRGG